MKKVKIAISILLVCALFLSVASCGKSTQDETTTTTQQYASYDETANNTISFDTATDSVTAGVVADTSAVVTTTQAPVAHSTETEAVQQSSEPDASQQTQAATQAQTTTATEETHQADGRTYYVYYPDGINSSKKTYPVLSWANGTGCQPSMYTNMFKALAKGGYIVIASSETMSADGTAQIAALDFIISLNNNSSSAAYKKVNTKALGVIGHSQGGRSSVNAAVADSRIKCVVSIAGSNYLEEAEKNSTPTLFIAGGSDMIVMSSQWIQPAYNAAKGPAVYASLNKAIHTTCCTNPEKYSAYILDWCNAWLKNDSAALKTFNSNGTLAGDSSWSGFQCKGF